MVTLLPGSFSAILLATLAKYSPVARKAYVKTSPYLSDIKHFLLVMLTAVLFVAWILQDRIALVQVNAEIRDDPRLSQFPYSFRLLKQEGDQLVMSTLSGRLSRYPVSLDTLLPVLFPELSGTPDEATLSVARRRFAQAQAVAQQKALELTGARSIVWEMDENWLRLKGILPNKTFYTVYQDL